MSLLFDRALAAASAVRSAGGPEARTGIVLGSGLNELAGKVQGGTAIPYDQIPHFPRTSVEGHQGRAIVGSLGGCPVLVLQGRFHYYEGHDLEAVTLPVRVMQCLGIRALILTAATGGIRLDLRAGDLVLLSDHLNLLGANPLRGAHDDRLGTRFPDMTEVYSSRLRKIAREEAAKQSINMTEGVYACLPGPSYETPAEIRMLRTLGADIVGMSTVPEAIAARHAGMEVMGIALVSNAAAGVLGTPITHHEVLEAGRAAAPALAGLIEAIVARISAEG